jgi:DNA polymerase-1
MSTSKGVATNALFGFIRAILNIQKDFSPDYLVVVFDGPKNKASRTAIYPDYKGHREKAPEDLYPQIDLAKKFCIAASIAIVEIDGFEADDAMGSIARWAKKEGLTSYLCSTDKDLCQLVDEQTFILHTNKENVLLKEKDVFEKYGILPHQFIDYLAIVGDASDNIPGIKSLGPKTATKLLTEFGSLKKIIENAPFFPNKKLGEKIVAERSFAEISYSLATIQIHLDIPQNLSFYQSHTPDSVLLENFYTQMEFSSLYKKTPQKALEKTHILIDDQRALKGVVQSLLSFKSIGIKTESEPIESIDKDIISITFCAHPGVCYFIPFYGNIPKGVILEELSPLFSRKISFFGHNIKNDLHTLSQVGLNISTIDFDTFIASYILDSHLLQHTLDILSKKYLDKDIPSIKEWLPKGGTFKDLLVDDAKNISCSALDALVSLKPLLEKKLLERGLFNLFSTIELPLIPILFGMERDGIYLNKESLKAYSVELTSKIEHLSQTIYSISKKEFNINSPKQLSEVLFHNLGIAPLKKGKSFESTGVETLLSLEKAHPIIPYILEYRTLEKLRSTYADALPKEINSRTHRIHCTFNQSGTVTGRLSCSSPNLQNIPIRTQEGKKIRESFTPQNEGWLFLSLDYSQIELRILAHMSGEKALISAFNNDLDIHKDTASAVFNVPLDKVTPQMRYQAKAVNFGILYGQSSFGLAKELSISVAEAKKIIDTYFEKYPKVYLCIQDLIDKAKRDKKTVSLLGRERPLPDIDSRNFALKGACERFAVNAPIQGSQADIIKIAMQKINKLWQCEDFKSFLVLQIHDELIFECPESEIDRCTTVVKGAMESAYLLSVPLKVDVSVGKNWSTC